MIWEVRWERPLHTFFRALTIPWSRLLCEPALLIRSMAVQLLANCSSILFSFSTQGDDQGFAADRDCRLHLPVQPLPEKGPALEAPPACLCVAGERVCKVPPGPLPCTSRTSVKEALGLPHAALLDKHLRPFLVIRYIHTQQNTNWNSMSVLT